METQAVTPYSPTTVYGQLSSPFIVKSVSINAHTANEAVVEDVGTFSRDYFTEGSARFKYAASYSPSSIASIQSENGIHSFSASSGSGDIVKTALNSGYSANEAITVSNAKAAYSRSAVATRNPVSALRGCKYNIS